MGEKIELSQRWYLVEDKSRVVPEGDPDARWLHWRSGDRVEVEEAVRLGAVKKKEPPAKKAPAKAPARSHHKKPPANKMADPPENKEGW